MVAHELDVAHVEMAGSSVRRLLVAMRTIGEACAAGRISRATRMAASTGSGVTMRYARVVSPTDHNVTLHLADEPASQVLRASPRKPQPDQGQGMVCEGVGLLRSGIE